MLNEISGQVQERMPWLTIHPSHVQLLLMVPSKRRCRG